MRSVKQADGALYVLVVAEVSLCRRGYLPVVVPVVLAVPAVVPEPALSVPLLSRVVGAPVVPVPVPAPVAPVPGPGGTPAEEVDEPLGVFV